MCVWKKGREVIKEQKEKKEGELGEKQNKNEADKEI